MATIIHTAKNDDGSESKTLRWTFTRGENTLINETATEHYLRHIRNAVVALVVTGAVSAVAAVASWIIIAANATSHY
ncbi:hypothetical protein [Humibacter ginsenosidimutans]|uniref:Uncharacterized protein n=1 Tax=Humibacter ginsenosidimutans TaxID=2599293 RepID=A0A5B8M395_9MICO|nr:hypothetical protein [Humibacter ginsenosidimutans]QDZ14255.1 hypothetical protein FPZ11_05270 [Humibacter ginsenosidimutans]